MSLKERLKNLLNTAKEIDNYLFQQDKERNKILQEKERNNAIREFNRSRYLTKLFSTVDDAYVNNFVQSNGIAFENVEEEIKASRNEEWRKRHNIVSRITHKIATFGPCKEDGDAIRATERQFSNNKDALDYFSKISVMQRCELVAKKLNSTKNNDYKFVCVFHDLSGMDFDDRATLEFSRYVPFE